MVAARRKFSEVDPVASRNSLQRFLATVVTSTLGVEEK
jgi:hypothetical protein